MLRGLVLAVGILAIAFVFLWTGKQESWAVLYAPGAPAQELTQFNVLVLDSDRHPSLALLKAQHKTVLGYLSLGEADPNRTFYPLLEEKDLLLPDDEQFQGHKVIDVRNPAWGKYVVNVLIPSIRRQGFDGVMIDALDNVTELESVEPEKYKGMRHATARLIRNIHKHYPDMKIMVNRGFAVLPAIAGSVDMVLAESIYSTVDPDSGELVTVPKPVYRHYTQLLKNTQKKNASLKIYTLDYWPQEDKKGVQQIYTAQRDSGFIPYVSTQDLQSIHHEPQ